MIKINCSPNKNPQKSLSTKIKTVKMSLISVIFGSFLMVTNLNFIFTVTWSAVVFSLIFLDI